MKTLIMVCVLVFAPSAIAGYGGSKGGVPSVPCYIDGEYHGTIANNECKRIGGKVPGEEGWKGKTI